MKSSNVELSIFDTTLRDGAQALPAEHQFPPGSKPEITDMIARMGVSVIEAGFPATPSDGEEVAEVARTVGQTSYTVDRWDSDGGSATIQVSPVITGLSRGNETDIEKTWDAVSAAERPRIHTFVPTDDDHTRAKFPGKTPAEIQAMAVRAIRYAKEISSAHPGASVEFSAEAASTTDPKYLERMVRDAVNAGADIINVPDTVGHANPMSMYHFYSHVIRWALVEWPLVTISAHNHNDMGQAVANTNMLVVAAREHALKNNVPVNVQVETTICGLGERAGNADVFPVVAGLFKSAGTYEPVTEFAYTYDTPPRPGVVRTATPQPQKVSWHFNPGQAVITARDIMERAGYEVPRQSPVVGSDTNTHRSGIHSDGIIKGSHRIYTPFDPTFWGHEHDAVHEDGRYQGQAGRVAVTKVADVERSDHD